VPTRSPEIQKENRFPQRSSSGSQSYRISHPWGIPVSIIKALRGVTLLQIQTLVIPPCAHHFLQHCPNVKDLTCTPSVRMKTIASLVTGKQRIIRFAATSLVDPHLPAVEFTPPPYPCSNFRFQRTDFPRPEIQELSIVHVNLQVTSATFNRPSRSYPDRFAGGWESASKPPPRYLRHSKTFPPPR